MERPARGGNQLELLSAYDLVWLGILILVCLSGLVLVLLGA